MRAGMVVFALLVGCDGGALQERDAEIERVKTQRDGYKARIASLDEELKQAKIEAMASAAEAARCSETTMAAALRARYTQEVAGFARMGFDPEKELNEEGHLRNAADFAARMKQYITRRYGKNSLAILVQMFGAEAGSAVFYGRVANE